MKIAILSPISWRTPPKKYGPWELVASVLTEGLVERGMDVTLFATSDSQTQAKLGSVCKIPLGESPGSNAKVWECLHISHMMERAQEFDIIHNHFDFLPLTYSRLIETPMVTTIHGFSSSDILPVYKKYNKTTSYISISKSDQHRELSYQGCIHHGINPEEYTYSSKKENYLLSFGRIHPDKGTHLAIKIAKEAGLSLKIAGLIQDEEYFNDKIKPHIDSGEVLYAGNAGSVIRNKLLANAAALLHPIGFKEPFGLSVIEAMMSGTPVIAFDKGSMGELIVDGKTGYLVNDVAESVQAIQRLSDILPENCHHHAIKNFHQDRMIDDYISIYRKILKSR